MATNNAAKQAFSRYAARNGQPPRQQEEMLEHRAVAVTLAILESEGKSRCVEAVRYVFFCEPTEINKKGEVHRRVIRFSTKCHVPIRTAYRWLSNACQLFDATVQTMSEFVQND